MRDFFDLADKADRVLRVRIKDPLLHRVLPCVPKVPVLHLILDGLALAEHHHDDGFDRRRLEWRPIGVQNVLKGDAIELALVDIRDLVIFLPHRGRGRGLEGVLEPIGAVGLGDHHLLFVGPAVVMVPRGPSTGDVIEDLGVWIRVKALLLLT